MLAVLAFSLAFAAEQRVVYDLTVNGEKVGTRELTVRYLPREGGERRVIEAYTKIAVAGTALEARTSGSAGPTGAQFTTSAAQDGAVSQVQGTELPGGGWRLIVADAGGVEEKTLARSEAQITSLDLLDPARNRVLQAPGSVGIVLVETGEILSGTVAEGKEGQITVGGQKVPVTRYVVDGTMGKASFDLDGNGLLLRSEVKWLGGNVIATAREVPPPRSYGDVEKIEDIKTEIEEEPIQ